MHTILGEIGYIVTREAYCALDSFALLAASAADRLNWVLIPSMRWTALRFLTQVIWKQVAVPWREAIVE